MHTPTTSSIVTSSASSFYSPSQLCFPYGKFSCSRQGEIACMIHGWAALPYESAVRHLESSALEKLIVLNHKRYFVSEDTQCNIVYLTFDPPVDRDVVRLGVYGTKPVDRLFCDQVQTMLNQRLIEITAKTVSRILTQNASLHASYITFLRQGGAQRHMTLSFVLPNYVQDVYFFCTIARQIFLNTQVLNRLFTNTQNIGDKKSAGKTILSFFDILIYAAKLYSRFRVQKHCCFFMCKSSAALNNCAHFFLHRISLYTSPSSPGTHQHSNVYSLFIVVMPSLCFLL